MERFKQRDMGFKMYVGAELFVIVNKSHKRFISQYICLSPLHYPCPQAHLFLWKTKIFFFFFFWMSQLFTVVWFKESHRQIVLGIILRCRLIHALMLQVFKQTVYCWDSCDVTILPELLAAWNHSYRSTLALTAFLLGLSALIIPGYL